MIVLYERLFVGLSASMCPVSLALGIRNHNDILHTGTLKIAPAKPRHQCCRHQGFWGYAKKNHKNLTARSLLWQWGF